MKRNFTLLRGKKRGPMPNFEAQALAAVPDLAESLYELEVARTGDTDVDAALAAWKGELSGKASPT